MKKFLLTLLTALLLCGSFSVIASAKDVAPKFSEKFFPEGTVSKPTDVYYEIVKEENGRSASVYVWLTQPEDVIDMFTEWTKLERDKFQETYECTIEKSFLQIDCKVDDGDWHYVEDWDIDEYPQEDQPYDLAIRQVIQASDMQKTYREGCALIDPWYASDDENAGYLKPLVYSKDDRWYLDLENHSLTLRMRYFIGYTNWDMSDEEKEANDGRAESILLSDWSDEITIGKNGTQEELKYPEKIEAPVISELTFIETTKRENGTCDSDWKVYVDFPKSNGDASKYYAIHDGNYSPLSAMLQYRVKTGDEWGEWIDTSWGNSDWLFSHWKVFATEGVSKDDSIEFRVYLKNDVEEGKDSPFSNSLFCNAGDEHAESTAAGSEQEGGETPEDEAPVIEGKSKCKLCGICPIQPLGICLFVWIALAVIVIILLVVLVKKASKKNKDQK